ncbi:MAG: TonB-dependent receptor [Acidobacteria bacterium]|nr:TonB-dependent receptor [Acidobacteriota bacterium]
MVLLLLLFSIPGALFAQAVSGTIHGVVRDPSDASIAGATVTVLNRNTNYTRSISTSAEGDYRFPSLPLGVYTLTVEHPGFSQFSQEGITLQVDQQARVDVTLQVGNVSEKVVVTSEAALVNTTNAETAEVVERQRIEQLPLNGRNFVQLIQLTTGTNAGAAGDQQNNLVINHFRGSAFFSANGMRTWYNNYILDGINNNESAWNSGGIILLPVIDAIQEFKVSTGNFSSEFGRAAGGVVNVQTRSGTNAFHGNAFEFFRNSALDANDFFNNASGNPKPAFRQNQFGATFGGPIRRDRAFFFMDYQGVRQRRELTYLASVATTAMREGDFSNPRLPVIYDPATARPSGTGIVRDPFPSRRIPSNRFDPAAVRFIDLMPSPNTGGADAIALNLINNPKWSREGNQGDIRLDYNFGPRSTIFGRYSMDKANQIFPNDLTTPRNPFGGGGRANQLDLTAQSLAINATRVVTNALVIEVRLGFNRYDFRGVPLGAGNTLVDKYKLPGSHIAQNALSITAMGITGLTTLGPTTGLPNFSVQNVYQYVFNASYTRARHSWKAGVDAKRFQRNNYFISAQPTGQFNFSANFTSQTGVGGGGAGFATYLLGLADSINRGSVSGRTGRRNTEWGVYLQDDFKLNSSLSLSYGIRYELFTPWYEVADRMSALDLATGKVILAGADNKFGRALRQGDYNNFAPRFGIAWRVPGPSKLVVRSGYGITYIEEFGGNGTNPIQNPPNSSTQQIVYSTTQLPPARLTDGIPVPGPVDINNPSGQYRQINYGAVAAYAQHWDFSLQREFGQHWLMDAAYAGSKGTNLLEITDPNQPAPGPGGINPRRPLFALAPNVTTNIGESIGNSSYHSFQLKMHKRFSRGYYVLGSYTVSKNIGDVDSNFSNGVPGVGSSGSAQNSRNQRADRSLTDTDVPQRLVVSYGWELPWLKGRRLAGGWQISGISTFSAGNPFDILFQPSTLNTGTFQRPDRVAGGRIDNWTTDRYFDITAFRSPAIYTFGNAGRNILRGPGLHTLDFSIIKDTRFSERYNLQWRTDFFNMANTPQFNSPGNTIGTAQAGRISSTRFSMNRQIQMVMKFFF